MRDVWISGEFVDESKMQREENKSYQVIQPRPTVLQAWRVDKLKKSGSVETGFFFQFYSILFQVTSFAICTKGFLDISPMREIASSVNL